MCEFVTTIEQLSEEESAYDFVCILMNTAGYKQKCCSPLGGTHIATITEKRSSKNLVKCNKHKVSSYLKSRLNIMIANILGK